MFIVTQSWLAFVFCLITMLCWGSWANTEKINQRLPFQLFYWDYTLAILLFSIILALTMGSIGEHGRPFLTDLSQAESKNLWFAFIGGVVFNLCNILLVAAIAIEGMSTAFSIAAGIGLALGVIINYIAQPVGNVVLLILGLILILLAIVTSANAYRRMGSSKNNSLRGIIISVISGLLMGFFYLFIAASMSIPQVSPISGKLTPYTAMVLFAVGIFLSNFIFNTYLMKKPVMDEPIPFSAYWRESLLNHALGWVGGIIWTVGTLFNLIASSKASFAISYGLGQGATMIAAAWGVLVWKEFANAPAGTSWRLSLMFVLYIAGLVSFVLARFL